MSTHVRHAAHAGRKGGYAIEQRFHHGDVAIGVDGE